MDTEMKVIDNRTLKLSQFFSREIPLARSIYFATAFINLSGLRGIEESVKAQLISGGEIELIFGLDFRLSDPGVIAWLIQMSKSYEALSFYAFSDPRWGGEPGFHPNLYVMERPDGMTSIVVGSSSLTRGGLEDNIELDLAMEVPASDPFAKEIKEAYRSYRAKINLFVPDEEYLKDYDRAFSRLRDSEGRALADPDTAQMIRSLLGRGDVLSHELATQKQLIINAMNSLRVAKGEYVHLRNITSWMEREARRLNLEFEWGSMTSIIKGRLDEHLVGRGGEELFERKKGKKEGEFYRLSKKGEEYRKGW